jgi:hypothetical protein
MTDNRHGDGTAMTVVQLICPNLRCRKILGVPEALRGKAVRCQHCQQVLRVPETGENNKKLSTAGGAVGKR